jgi:hypothetical protein
MVTRGKSKFADYVLYYKPNIPIAIIEAKENNPPRGGRTPELPGGAPAALTQTARVRGTHRAGGDAPISTAAVHHRLDDRDSRGGCPLARPATGASPVAWRPVQTPTSMVRSGHLPDSSTAGRSTRRFTGKNGSTQMGVPVRSSSPGAK